MEMRLISATFKGGLQEQERHEVNQIQQYNKNLRD